MGAIIIAVVIVIAFIFFLVLASEIGESVLELFSKLNCCAILVVLSILIIIFILASFINPSIFDDIKYFFEDLYYDLR